MRILTNQVQAIMDAQHSSWLAVDFLLLWAAEAGSLDSAKAIIADLLTAASIAYLG